MTTFPPGYINTNPSNTCRGWGWMSMLLPQLGQATLSNALRTSTPSFESGLHATTALTVTPQTVQTVVSAFRCHSDNGSPVILGVNNIPFGRSNHLGVAGTDPGWVDTSTGGGSKLNGSLQVGTVVGTGNYAEVFTAMTNLAPFTVTTESFGGSFGANSKCGFRDMTDGSSNVIAVGARYTPINSTLTEFAIRDGTWVGVENNFAPGQGAVLGEASVAINFSLAPPTPRLETTGFGSMHSGGCHFLMGDGSVQVISENIDMDTYRQLSRTAYAAVIRGF